MPIIKCKMCGGDMEISEDKTFGVCEYCGTSMTLPKVDSEQRAAAFNRGNYFRRIGEFDKALAVYERIVAENNSDAEAHWCCALCRFGIEYVEDPATYEWLPTCHRASFDSFLDDVDYLAAVECSDGVTQRQYQKDAAKIAEVQRGILATSQKEEPFDVFICYKESDDNGQRTVDSTLAQDIYYQLTDKGRRVFFARITLEDKGGTEYEPYIFAALNSAKVMVVIGTKEEYLNAVWVKNEWSRFLSLMKKDNTKLLLPCYRDMNPYDMPDQLSVLQSYDMSKIGFIQDLLRGIDKVLDADNAAEIKKETVVIQGEGGGNIAALTKRGNMALENGDWNGANDFFDRVLDYDAECAEAYLGKALAEAHAVNLRQLQEEFVLEPEQAELEEIEVTVSGHEEREEALAAENEVLGYLAKEEIQKLFVCNFRYQSRSNNYERQMEHSLQLLADNKNLSRAEKYAGGALKAEISSFKESIRSEMEQTLRTARAQDEQSEQDVREQYERTFAQWEQQITQMRLEAKARREAEYQQAVSLFKEQKYGSALVHLRPLQRTDYKETADYISKIEKIQAERKKKHTKNGIIAGSAAAAAIAAVLIVVLVVIPASKYKSAEALLAEGKLDDAIAAFSDLGDYKDASERVFIIWDKITQRATISSGTYFSVGLKSDGTVVA
ncbi:MAG: toll/interleukin-1 receptor domain-containing protein, partial [Oscillospiraceae bacterium]|nr:toll/interleukin-1 receptor domain-containing protein [Oscillospiraceae bacterium]